VVAEEWLALDLVSARQQEEGEGEDEADEELRPLALQREGPETEAK
jgi:hypothetical protein